MARRSLQHQPSRLVTAEAKLSLKLEGRDAVRVAGDQMDCHEPDRERQLGVVHHRARRHRGLPTTGCAFPGVFLAG